MYNTKLGGSSLLDTGIYPVFAALTSLGIPETIKTFADFCTTGAEESISMIFKYKDGEMASLNSSIAAYSPVQTEYLCEKGYLVLNPRWFTPTDITVWKEGKVVHTIKSEHFEGHGYQYEIQHIMEYLDAGLIESPKMTWQMSRDLLGILDRVRIDAGIFYPDHDKNLFL